MGSLVGWQVTVCFAVCREERQFNQTLREEQDAAYLESLRADQEKVGERTCVESLWNHYWDAEPLRGFYAYVKDL